MIKKRINFFALPILLVLSVIVLWGGSKQRMNKEKVVATKASYKTANEKIRQDIFDYITCELNDTNKRAEDIVNELATCDDIEKEFHTWLTTRRFLEKNEGAIEVAGYTAKKLAEENRGRLGPIGVYRYMVKFRKDPKGELKKYKLRPFYF